MVRFLNKERIIMKKVGIILSVCILIFFGCATSYQPVGFTGGYEETRLDENVFSVFFRGNGYTSRQRAVDFALLRSAELAITHGYEYFVILESNSYLSTSTYTTPTQTRTTGEVGFYGNSAYGTSRTTAFGGQTYYIRKPRVSLMIMCFKEKPDIEATVFNARFLSDSINGKYDIK